MGNILISSGTIRF